MWGCLAWIHEAWVCTTAIVGIEVFKSSTEVCSPHETHVFCVLSLNWGEWHLNKGKVIAERNVSRRPQLKQEFWMTLVIQEGSPQSCKSKATVTTLLGSKLCCDNKLLHWELLQCTSTWSSTSPWIGQVLLAWAEFTLMSGQADVIRATEPGPPSPPEDRCGLAMSQDKSRYESAIETCICHTHYVYQHGTLNCQAHSHPSWEDTWHWRASAVGVGRWTVWTINENHFSASLFVTLLSLSWLSSIVSKFHSGLFHAVEWWSLFLLKTPSWLKYKNTVKCLQNGKKNLLTQIIFITSLTWILSDRSACCFIKCSVCFLWNVENTEHCY